MQGLKARGAVEEGAGPAGAPFCSWDYELRFWREWLRPGNLSIFVGFSPMWPKARAGPGSVYPDILRVVFVKRNFG